MKMNRGRVTIFYPSFYLGAVNFLRDAAILLGENGYSVEIYSKFGSSPPPMFWNAPVYIVDNQFAVFKGLSVKMGLWASGRLGRVVRTTLSYLAKPQFRRFITAKHRQLPYICLIGIDPEGLLEARRWGEIMDVPFAYWSFEIYAGDKTKTASFRLMKEKEKEDSRRSAFVIVQDPWRSSILVKENGLDPKQLVHVPNAPRGPARRLQGDFLRKRFNIPQKSKVILYAGQLAWWSMSAQIASAVADWPEEYVLVMQSRGQVPKQRMSEFTNLSGTGKVFFAFDPVPLDQYRHMLDSADVGLAFYDPSLPGQPSRSDINLEVMGLSSGKLSDYLWCGLPVVVNDRTVGPGAFVNDSGCGMCVTEPQEILCALDDIFSNYTFFSENACRCFDDRLDLERNFEPVLQRLHQLVKA
jgi:glycosyltransferase involved in cell wall biosynthesis